MALRWILESAMDRVFIFFFRCTVVIRIVCGNYIAYDVVLSSSQKWQEERECSEAYRFTFKLICCVGLLFDSVPSNDDKLPCCLLDLSILISEPEVQIQSHCSLR